MPKRRPPAILAEGHWRCEQVTCVYAPAASPDPQFTAYAKAFWESHRVLHPSAFDGPMLGLATILKATPAQLTLLVKPTSYSEYVATRDPSFERSHPGMSRANPLGITAIIISVDDRIIVTKRSLTAEQNPGLPYFLGGYAEPTDAVALENLICANAMREVTEELGVRDIRQTLVIGIASDPLFCHPELFTVMRVASRATDLADAWKKADGRQEASLLLSLPLSKLLKTTPNVLFPEGVTWSFEIGLFLLKRHWKEIERFMAAHER